MTNFICLGPANVLGMQCHEFTQYNCLRKDPSKLTSEDTVILQVSAGFRHQSAITVKGELFTWGNNIDGCCIQSIQEAFIKEPRKVSNFNQACNIALGKPCTVSSVYGNHSPSLAVDGNTDGHLENLIHTQVDPQPFCEIDLEDFALISKINVWNRTDEAHTMGMQKDAYSRKLFPCWVLVSQEPFPEGIGDNNLRRSIDISNASIRLTENKRLSTIICRFTMQLT